MSRRAGFAPVDGTSLYYELSGSGPAVVLVHARGLDRRMWDEQVPALAGRYTVVQYDLRGFGRSAAGENPYSHGDDLAALLDSLGLERVAPVGASLGGGAAINFAVQFPARLWALVPVDSSLGGFAWSAEFQGALAGLQRAASESGVGEAKRRYFAMPLFRRVLTRPESLGRVREMIRDYDGSHWTRPDLGRPLNPPAISRLADIPVPTRVIVGEHDLPDFHAIAEILARDIPRAHRVVMPALGHLPSMEDPPAFNRVLLEFLDAVSAGSAADSR